MKLDFGLGTRLLFLFAWVTGIGIGALGLWLVAGPSPQATTQGSILFGWALTLAGLSFVLFASLIAVVVNVVDALKKEEP